MALGFSLLSDPDTTVYRNFVVATQAYTIGDSVDVSRTTAGVVPSTATSNNYALRGVAMQTVLNTATSLLVALCTPRQLWTADATNTGNTAHNLQRMKLTDKATVNNTGTDDTSVNAIFEQAGVVNATNKRIVGRFLQAANVTA